MDFCSVSCWLVFFFPFVLTGEVFVQCNECNVALQCVVAPLYEDFLFMYVTDIELIAEQNLPSEMQSRGGEG